MRTGSVEEYRVGVFVGNDGFERDAPLAGAGAAVPFEYLLFGNGELGGSTIKDPARVFVLDGKIVFIHRFARAEEDIVFYARDDFYVACDAT